VIDIDVGELCRAPLRRRYGVAHCLRHQGLGCEGGGAEGEAALDEFAPSDFAVSHPESRV